MRFSIASLLADETVKGSPTDIWGNVRIPMLESSQAKPDDSGWYDLSLEGEIVYTSLIGVPIAGLPAIGNTIANATSSIDTSYWTLNCPSVEEVFLNSSAYDRGGFFIVSSNHTVIWQSNGKITPSTLARRLTYNGTLMLPDVL